MLPNRNAASPSFQEEFPQSDTNNGYFFAQEPAKEQQSMVNYPQVDEYVNSTISPSTNVSNQSENNTQTADLMETGKTELYSFCLRSNDLS